MTKEVFEDEYRKLNLGMMIRKIYCFSSPNLRSMEQAEDWVQESLLSAYRNRSTLQFLGAYVMAASKRMAIKAATRYRIHPVLNLDETQDSGQGSWLLTKNPEESYITKRMIDECIQMIPLERNREIVSKYLADGERERHSVDCAVWRAKIEIRKKIGIV